MYHLRIRKDGKLLDSITLKDDHIILGNLGKSGLKRPGHINLYDPSVSGAHAILKKKDSLYIVQNLATEHGLKVNGTVETEITLKHNDQINIGVFTLEFSKIEEMKLNNQNKRTYSPSSSIQNINEIIKPGKGDGLEVIVAWKERVLSTQNFSAGQTINFGNSKACDIFIPDSDSESFQKTLISFEPESTTVFHQSDFKNCQMSSILETNDVECIDFLQELKSMKKIDLQQGQMLSIGLANDISISIRYIKATPKVIFGPLLSFSRSEGLGVAASIALSFLLALSVNLMTNQDDPEEEEKAKLTRMAKFMFQSPLPKAADLSKASAAAGNMAKKAAARKGGMKKIAKHAGASAKSVAPDVSKVGVLGVFGAHGVRKNIDKSSSGAGVLQGVAANATGGVGEDQDLSGSQIGKALSDSSGNSLGASAIGIDGVGTAGKADGIAGGASGLGGMGGTGSVQISLGGDDQGFVGQIDKEAIRRVIAKNIRQVRACYENALNRSPNLSGKLVLQWEIDPEGQPTSASVKNSSLGSTTVAGCVIERLNTWRFPKPPAGVTGLVAYPFSFESTKQINGG